jgi:cell fate regulator YaaT (PSP1 superfamily)
LIILSAVRSTGGLSRYCLLILPDMELPSRYVVRYGTTRHVAEFGVRGREPFERGQSVVVRSDRGHEIGEVLCPASERTREWLGTTESKGQIVRVVTEEDRLKADELTRKEREQFIGGKELIEQSKLQMQLVDVEHIFGGERLVFYYVAEARIDFRELVKALAGKFQMRIEMRQIGVRDEAKVLADYGDCGKPVCCNTHLREMPPVSMKMAKLQKATLDPNKISGRCGRLKCCLRYEYDTYEAHRKELPAIGVLVVTKQGQGKVINHELLAKKLLVQFEDRRMLVIDAKDVLTVLGKPKRDERSDERASDVASGGDGPEGVATEERGADEPGAAVATATESSATDESTSRTAPPPRSDRSGGERGGGNRSGDRGNGGRAGGEGGPRADHRRGGSRPDRGAGPGGRGPGSGPRGAGPGGAPGGGSPGSGQGGRPPRGPRRDGGPKSGPPADAPPAPPAPPENRRPEEDDDFGAGV